MQLNVLKKTLLILMINIVHGKTTENLGESINVRPVNNENICHERKPVLTLNRPIYVAFTVLKLSKWLMYDFHYNFIKKKLMPNCYLLTQMVLLWNFVKKILKQWNWIISSFSQFNKKNSDKSSIWSWKTFSRNFIRHWKIDWWTSWLDYWINWFSIH